MVWPAPRDHIDVDVRAANLHFGSGRGGGGGVADGAGRRQALTLSSHCPILVRWRGFAILASNTQVLEPELRRACWTARWFALVAMIVPRPHAGARRWPRDAEPTTAAETAAERTAASGGKISPLGLGADNARERTGDAVSAAGAEPGLGAALMAECVPAWIYMPALHGAGDESGGCFEKLGCNCDHRLAALRGRCAGAGIRRARRLFMQGFASARG